MTIEAKIHPITKLRDALLAFASVEIGGKIAINKPPMRIVHRRYCFAVTFVLNRPILIS